MNALDALCTSGTCDAIGTCQTYGASEALDTLCTIYTRGARRPALALRTTGPCGTHSTITSGATGCPCWAYGTDNTITTCGSGRTGGTSWTCRTRRTD